MGERPARRPIVLGAILGAVRGAFPRLAAASFAAAILVALPVEARDLAGAEPTTHAGFLRPTPFGGTGLRMVDARAFSKWQDVLERFARQSEPDGDARLALARKSFAALVSRLAGQGELSQAALVNAAMERIAYAQDADTFGVEDHWATPYEFLDAAKGDCEDRAIAKYLALKAAGFPENRLRIVVGADERANAIHAVLAVEIEGRAYALDNLSSGVVAWETLRRTFTPYASLAAGQAWLHRIAAASR